jgi:hypothetical protein
MKKLVPAIILLLLAAWPSSCPAFLDYLFSGSASRDAIDNSAVGDLRAWWTGNPAYQFNPWYTPSQPAPAPTAAGQQPAQQGSYSVTPSQAGQGQYPPQPEASYYPSQAPQGYGQPAYGGYPQQAASPQGFQGYQQAPQQYQTAPQQYQGMPQQYQTAPQQYQTPPQYQTTPQQYPVAQQQYQPMPQQYQSAPQGYQPMGQ